MRVVGWCLVMRSGEICPGRAEKPPLLVKLRSKCNTEFKLL